MIVCVCVCVCERRIAKSMFSNRVNTRNIWSTVLAHIMELMGVNGPKLYFDFIYILCLTKWPQHTSASELSDSGSFISFHSPFGKHSVFVSFALRILDSVLQFCTSLSNSDRCNTGHFSGLSAALSLILVPGTQNPKAVNGESLDNLVILTLSSTL